MHSNSVFHSFTYQTGQLLVETKIELLSGKGHLNNEPRKPKGKQTFMRTACDKTNSVNSDPSFSLLVRIRKCVFQKATFKN